MENRFEKLETLLRRNGFTSYLYMQDGLKQAEVNVFLENNKVDVELTKEIYDLYKWHNGQLLYTHSLGELELFLSGIFYPIEHALFMYKNYFDLGSYLLPIFGTGDTIHFFIDLDKSSVNYGFIKYYSHDISEPLTIYPSLQALFDCLIECYENELYYPDLNGRLVISDSSTSVEKKYGAGCKFWDFVA